MRVILMPALVVFLLSICPWGDVFAETERVSSETSESLAVKGRLLLSDDFTELPARKTLHSINETWQQRISFGDWTPRVAGGVHAENVPADGHGPVLTYLAPIDDVIIECEFRLPPQAQSDRHFRIFLDHPDYRGHTIAANANVSSAFQPTGLTLLHNPKTAAKEVTAEVRFGPTTITVGDGEWHLMRLELLGDQARVSVDGLVLAGSHPALRTTKHKIGLNPGKAGGDLRHFRVWEAIAK